MLEIDGAHGEGGGQILRTAVAMSMVTGTEIRVKNIRANRPNPGLSHQHMMAVEAAAEMSGAEVRGLKKRSTEITFSPNSVTGGEYEFDIGTAGSVTLLLQALIPAVVSKEKRASMVVTGGTDVKWSPPYDYFENVFLRHLRNMDIEVTSRLIKRGHYPKGGGKIEVSISPSEIGSYRVEDDIKEIKGRSFVTDLPDHIASRMRKSAEEELSTYPVSIVTESYSSPSPGTGITLWTTGPRILGSGILGEKGIPAEEVGTEAASLLKRSIESDADIDKWSSDQLIPYLSMTDDSGELFVTEKTGHLETNIWVVNQFAENEIELEECEDGYKIFY